MTDLHPEHTAILLHWCGAGAAPDQTFIYEGIKDGEELHSLIDALLEEHVSVEQRAQIRTEISLYWHRKDGSWDAQEYISTYA